MASPFYVGSVGEVLSHSLAQVRVDTSLFAQASVVKPSSLRFFFLPLVVCLVRWRSQRSSSGCAPLPRFLEPTILPPLLPFWSEAVFLWFL